MDPLSSLDSIADLIRRRASEATSNKADKNYSDKLSQARQKHVIAKKQTAESIKFKIVNAIRAIRDTDERKNQKLVGIFVENVLLWQLGEELINDPSFASLVDEVSSSLLTESSVINELKNL